MDPFISLLMTCVGMFLVSLCAGYLPLSASLSRRQMKNVTLLGAGLLVGTAFVVIIPEGIHMMYGVDGPPSIQTPATYTPLTLPPSSSRRRLLHDDHDHDHVHTAATTATNTTTTKCARIDNPNTRFIGLALVVGFVFQLLVDHLAQRLSGGHHGHGHGHGHHHHHHRQKSDDDAPSNKKNSSSIAIELVNTSSSSSSSSTNSANTNSNATNSAAAAAAAAAAANQNTSFSTFIGIIIHSAVDGIAMGTVSFTENSAMEALIFLAIALHKAPAAFGITSVMIHSGSSRADIMEKLLLFSLSAPLMALATFFVLGTGVLEPQTAKDYLGLCMLFSAGTFLYVATVHVLPELTHDGVLDTSSTIVLVIGIILPYFMAMGHSHGGGGDGHDHSHHH